jgi:hypothetical protein
VRLFRFMALADYGVLHYLLHAGLSHRYGSYSSSHGTLFSNIAGGPPPEEVDVRGRLWVIAGGNVCGHR